MHTKKLCRKKTCQEKKNLRSCGTGFFQDASLDFLLPEKKHEVRVEGLGFYEGESIFLVQENFPVQLFCLRRTALTHR